MCGVQILCGDDGQSVSGCSLCSVSTSQLCYLSPWLSGICKTEALLPFVIPILASSLCLSMVLAEHATVLECVLRCILFPHILIQQSDSAVNWRISHTPALSEGG